MPGLRDLRNGVDLLAVARHGDEARCGREIQIPDIVFDPLKMPDALTGSRIQRQHAVGEQIVADAVRAIEIERRGAGGCEDHPELGIDAEPRPGVGAAGDLVRVLGPGFVAEFAGPGDGVKDPALACPYERRRRGCGLANRAGSPAPCCRG